MTPREGDRRRATSPGSARRSPGHAARRACAPHRPWRPPLPEQCSRPTSHGGRRTGRRPGCRSVWWTGPTSRRRTCSSSTSPKAGTWLAVGGLAERPDHPAAHGARARPCTGWGPRSCTSTSWRPAGARSAAEAAAAPARRHRRSAARTPPRTVRLVDRLAQEVAAGGRAARRRPLLLLARRRRGGRHRACWRSADPGRGSAPRCCGCCGTARAVGLPCVVTADRAVPGGRLAASVAAASRPAAARPRRLRASRASRRGPSRGTGRPAGPARRGRDRVPAGPPRAGRPAPAGPRRAVPPIRCGSRWLPADPVPCPRPGAGPTGADGAAAADRPRRRRGRAARRRPPRAPAGCSCRDHPAAGGPPPSSLRRHLASAGRRGVLRIGRPPGPVRGAAAAGEHLGWTRTRGLGGRLAGRPSGRPGSSIADDVGAPPEFRSAAAAGTRARQRRGRCSRPDAAALSGALPGPRRGSAPRTVGAPAVPGLRVTPTCWGSGCPARRSPSPRLRLAGQRHGDRTRAGRPSPRGGAGLDPAGDRCRDEPGRPVAPRSVRGVRAPARSPGGRTRRARDPRPGRPRTGRPRCRGPPRARR